MARPNMFNNMNLEGVITKPLDIYLTQLANKPNDRALNVNAPSVAGSCLRASYYGRMKYVKDRLTEPRSLRIFNNGDHVHTRLQTYLLDMNMLIMDEVPLINDDYNIQGHTDGYIELSDDEIAILEIKSINDGRFSKLKRAKDEHECQGLIYLYCAEERRKFLHNTYKTLEEFYASEQDRADYFRAHYQHMKGGKKYTREQKIENEVNLNLISDDVLYHTKKPITKVIFLYENKNDQNIKEYILERSEVEHMLEELLEDYVYLDECCRTEVVPPRPEGFTKSCYSCHWCDYASTCWVV